MTLRKRIALTLGLTAAFSVGTLAAPAEAKADIPYIPTAQGVFNAATGDMCPGGSNGARCDRYGTSRCYRPAGWNHTVYCKRTSVDYRTFLKIPYSCKVVGRVNHSWGVTHKVYYGCVRNW